MKRKKYNIRNLDELHQEVLTLKVDYQLKGDLLAHDAKAYVKQFTPGHLFKKYVSAGNLLKFDDKLNISGTLMSLLLPGLLNKTIFRGSGVITKTVVALASRTLGKSLDAEHLAGMFSSAKNWVGNLVAGKGKKKKEVKFVDYGIPPDSETY
ncbi:hypothetical protein C7T94_03340 [Pedobacter yulinensis]|uniref:Uncharacterized protein n=1 Tax=Pedobacter yulinensis TaxID=2126353 RepID=A0A2T3HRX4_9SPHI|nr:hypothetical protein [Pedobacter yulinensis]PST85153.1 hypothetical protein C7T94_03340 [Pedobacter yulinensis]